MGHGDKLDKIDEGLSSYSKRVEQSFVFRSARVEDLEDMMANKKDDILGHFPNIVKSTERVAKAPPRSLTPKPQ